MNRVLFIILGDFFSFLIAFISLIFIRFDSSLYSWAFSTHALPFLILYVFWVNIFYIFGLYDLISIKPTIPFLKRWFFALFTSFVVGLMFFYFVPMFGISPKVNLFIQVGLFGLFSFIFRRIIYSLFAKTFTKNTILIGESKYLKELETLIDINPQTGLSKKISLSSKVEDLKDDLLIDGTIIIIDNKKDVGEKFLLDLHNRNIEVMDTATAYEKYLYKIPVEYINTEFITNNINIKKDILYYIFSRILDIVFSLILLIVLSPVLIICGLLIYLEDKGPIFYTQTRVGLNGKIFKLYKLRSMSINAERDGVKWSTGKDDPRITRIGNITRRLHIDEIPQMINILKGDITLVGPRPERPEFVEKLEKEIPHYNMRHTITPGFTGWAQIKYHYAKTIDESKEKFEYDLYYIKNRNIFIDIGIILRTIIIIFTH